MEHTISNREIHATLWPQRLVNIRRSLNRSSRIIAFISLAGLAACAFWVSFEVEARGMTFNILDINTWMHPAYISSFLFAIMTIYAMRQVNRTRQRLNPLGYPLLEKIDTFLRLDVWRSVEPLTLRPVLLHVIQPDRTPAGRAAWKATSQSWIRRAEKARRLTSPHLARMIDTGCAQYDQFYAAMEMPRGMRLDALIERHGPVPLDRSLYLLAQLAHAIQNAHAQGISPLELKPRHIWIGHRSLNEDWLSLVPFGYEEDDAPDDDSILRDGKEFARTAIGLLTGEKPASDAAEDLVAIDESLTRAGIPFLVRDQLRQCLAARAGDPMPPVHEIMQRLWVSQQGETWNNDRAARWWRDHADREGD